LGITVGIYTFATVASGGAWNFASFFLIRFLTGIGIGGEYAVVNATIQEFIPARMRGSITLLVNGSFWLGAASGALLTMLVLRSSLPPELAWRVVFVVSGATGFVVLLLRRWLPESPRWLMTHGKPREAELILAEIERTAQDELGTELPAPKPTTLRLRTGAHLDFGASILMLLRRYWRRIVFTTVMMSAQAFCYNGVVFNFSLILVRFYDVRSTETGSYMLLLALGNFAGPLLLGRFFDSIGRRQMMFLTYSISGLLIIAAGCLFWQSLLDATGQTIVWTVVFFFASTAASSAYLAAGETFPSEIRAITIAVFFSLGTGIAGALAPALFGALIDTGSRSSLMLGHLFCGGLMLIAAFFGLAMGVRAERRGLEDVAPPLSSSPPLAWMG
jgi:MFS family permease